MIRDAFNALRGWTRGTDALLCVGEADGHRFYVWLQVRAEHGSAEEVAARTLAAEGARLVRIEEQAPPNLRFRPGAISAITSGRIYFDEDEEG